MPAAAAPLCATGVLAHLGQLLFSAEESPSPIPIALALAPNPSHNPAPTLAPTLATTLATTLALAPTLAPSLAPALNPTGAEEARLSLPVYCDATRDSDPDPESEMETASNTPYRDGNYDLLKLLATRQVGV